MANCSPALNRAMRVSAAVRTRAALDNGVSTAMLPALAALRNARTGLDALNIAENEIPEHMIIPALNHIAQRPNGFAAPVVETLCRLVGWQKLSCAIEHNRAMSLWRTYCGEEIAL